MIKHFLFLAAMIAWLADAPNVHGQTRSWRQNAPTTAANPTVQGVRPATGPQAAPGAMPAGYAAGYFTAAAPQAAFARVMPSLSAGGTAATPAPNAAAYYTAQAPTPAPPLGGTTVPQPVIAPSITGSQPTYPMPAAGPTWSDGSMPVETLPPTTMMYPGAPMNAPAGTPTPAPPHSGQPHYAAPAYAPQSYGPAGGYPPRANYAPPAGYGPSPSYAAPSNFTPSNFTPSPMGSSYEPETTFDPGAAWEAPGQHHCGPWFVSVAFMMMTRDAPNNVPLTYENTVPQLTVMNSETATSHDWAEGGEIRIGRAIGDRWAVEGVYWGLDTFAEQIGVRSLGNTLNSRLDFENITFQGAPLSDVFDNSRDQRFYRQDIFENIEINLMQQALQVDPAGCFGMTSFVGVRYFRFDELTHLEATAAGVDYGTVDDTSPFYSDYRVTMHNRMIGGQIGARGTMNLGCKFRLFAIPRFGIYANNISMKQHVCRTLNMGSEKIDVALMGQLDLGASYQILPCVSVFTSYRGMGFAGVATADDNITRSFEAVGDIGSINSAGSLILHGWQSGVQMQF